MHPLWKHQVEAIEKGKRLPNLALLMEIGTGKSRTMVEITRYRFNLNKRILRTIIFAPISVCVQWKTEFGKFSKIDPAKIVVLTGSGKDRTTQLQSLKDPGVIIVTNYESVLIPSFYQALLTWHPEVVIYDESQKCKSAQSERHKKLIPISDAATHRYILTGTPVLNNPMDLFGQYRLLDQGYAFGKSFFNFRKNYFYDKNAGMPKQKHFPKWEVRRELLPQFSEIISQTAAQAKKSDCLDLPPLVKTEVPISLGKDQKKAYDMMKVAYLAELDGVTTVAEFAMTKTLRLQQILCGYVQGDEGEVTYCKDNPRLDAFVETLEALGGKKVIVWTTFRPTYTMLERVALKLGRKVVFITGEQSAKEKAKAIEDFCRGDADTLISNPSAGGAGINLQESAYSIYYTRSYSLGDFLQSEGRNYRAGSEQHEKVQHFHLVAKDTLDEQILQALMNKHNLAESILAWARKEKEK